jgi:hypothetical protein
MQHAWSIGGLDLGKKFARSKMFLPLHLISIYLCLPEVVGNFFNKALSSAQDVAWR